MIKKKNWNVISFLLLILGATTFFISDSVWLSFLALVGSSITYGGIPDFNTLSKITKIGVPTLAIGLATWILLVETTDVDVYSYFIQKIFTILAFGIIVNEKLISNLLK